MNTLKQTYSEEGAAVIPLNELFLTPSELDYLDNLSQNEAYERLDDENQLRNQFTIIEDVSADHAKQSGKEAGVRSTHHSSARVLSLLFKKQLQEVYREIHPDAKRIRKIQFNILEEGDFVGAHIDNTSCPKYALAAILFLSDDYEGGVFRIHHPPFNTSIKPRRGDIMLCRADVKHWVEPITKGERKTLAYFLGADHDIV